MAVAASAKMQAKRMNAADTDFMLMKCDDWSYIAEGCDAPGALSDELLSLRLATARDVLT